MSERVPDSPPAVTGEELFVFFRIPHVRMDLQKSIRISTLSPRGRYVLRESGFFALYPCIRKEAMDVLEASEVATFFELESASYAFLRSIRDDAPLHALRQYASLRGLPFQSILRLAALVIRDEYFRTHDMMYV